MKLKQLFPLQYISKYSTEEGRFICTFKMQFGKVLNQTHYRLAND